MTTPREREDALDRGLRRLSAGPSSPTLACLDGETAAAWSDGGLSSAERARVELHLADCVRCQTLVGALGRTDHLVLPAPSETGANWWRAWLRWMVPLTAAASAVIALTVWLRVPAPAPSPAEPAATSMARLPEAPVAAPQAAPPPAASSTPAAPDGTSASAPAQAPSPRSSSNREVEAATETARQPESAAPRALAKAEESTAVQSPPPSAGAVPQRQEFRDQAMAAPPASVRARDEARGAFDVTSPDGSTTWRVSGTAAQRSTDRGASWSAPAALGAQLSPLAGSSSSPEVCWLVGSAGLVLRTTDGMTWTRVPFPEQVDLTSVRATGARAARVTTADGRTFTTGDAATWTLTDP